MTPAIGGVLVMLFACMVTVGVVYLAHRAMTGGDDKSERETRDSIMRNYDDDSPLFL